MDLNVLWKLAVVDAQRALQPGGLLDLEGADVPDFSALYLEIARRNFLNLAGPLLVKARQAMATEPIVAERLSWLTTDQYDETAYYVERSLEVLWEIEGTKVLANYSYDAHPARAGSSHDPAVVIVTDNEVINLPVSTVDAAEPTRLKAFASEVRAQLDMRLDLSKKISSVDQRLSTDSVRRIGFGSRIAEAREIATSAKMAPAIFREEDPSAHKIVEHDLQEIEDAALAKSIDVGVIEYALDAAYQQLSLMHIMIGDPEQSNRLNGLTSLVAADRAAKLELLRDAELVEAMARGFDSEGDLAQADQFYQEALDGYRAATGVRSEQVLQTLETYGEFKSRAGQYDESVALLEEYARLRYGAPGETREGIRAWLKVCEAIKNVPDSHKAVEITHELAKTIPLDSSDATASELVEHCLILEGTTEALMGIGELELAEVLSREAVVAGVTALTAERRIGVLGEEDAILLGSHEQLIEILKISNRRDEAVVTTREYLRVAQQFGVKESVSAAKQMLDGFDFPSP